MSFSRIVPQIWGSCHSQLPFSPMGEVAACQIESILYCCGVGAVLTKVPPLPPQHTHMQCWNLPSGGLDFYELSPIHGYLPTLALWVFPNWKKLGRVREIYWFCSPYQSLSAYYQMHRCWRLLLGLLANVSGSHDSHRGTSVNGWMPY